jgi:hypothetical protein
VARQTPLILDRDGQAGEQAKSIAFDSLNAGFNNYSKH